MHSEVLKNENENNDHCNVLTQLIDLEVGGREC
jgi:hypothetical protein